MSSLAHFLRSRNRHGAPVDFVASPLHQAALLQSIENAGHRGLADVYGARKHADGHRLQAGHFPQRHQLRGGQAEVLQQVARVQVHRTNDPAHGRDNSFVQASFVVHRASRIATK